MKKIDLSVLNEKQIRTLRNALNNRLESFKKNPDSPKELQKSHKLFGLSEAECVNLLKQVREVIKK